MATTFSKMTYPTSLEPAQAWPLDSRIYFENKISADNKALSAKTAGDTSTNFYIGQIITVYEQDPASNLSNTVKHYYIGHDKKLHEIADLETANSNYVYLSGGNDITHNHAISGFNEFISSVAISDLIVNETKISVANISSETVLTANLSNAGISNLTVEIADIEKIELNNAGISNLTAINSQLSNVNISNLTAENITVDFSKLTDDKTNAAQICSDLSIAIKQKIWIDTKDPYLSDYSDLSIIKIAKDEYDAKVLNHEILCGNVIYVVSSDYIDAYGQQLCNLWMSDIKSTAYEGIATTKPYVDEICGNLCSVIEQTNTNIKKVVNAISTDNYISTFYQTIKTGGNINAIDLSTGISVVYKMLNHIFNL